MSVSNNNKTPSSNNNQPAQARKVKRWLIISLFISAWLLLISSATEPSTELIDYSLFSLLGVIGAIFANSTGAGGGVIFIPMFNQLNFSEAQAVATSFAIQCFGMTAGATTWYLHYKREKTELRLWQGFKRIIVVGSITSIIGLWFIYGNQITPPASLHFSFSWFSLVLGLFIIATVFWAKPHRERSQLHWGDLLSLAVIGLVGGGITAWLSVGVGEIIAIYLIVRRFDINMAVATAVIISAFTVWAAISQHTLIAPSVVYPVVVFAGPAAILGGIFAKVLVTHLSATRLKLFFATWLLVIGFVGI